MFVGMGSLYFGFVPPACQLEADGVIAAEPEPGVAVTACAATAESHSLDVLNLMLPFCAESHSLVVRRALDFYTYDAC